MKKLLILALVFSFVLSLASTALAIPVDFTGDFRLQGRYIDDGVWRSYEGSWFQLRGRLNFEGKVDENTTVFGRFSIRNDFGGSTTSNNEFDHYGVKIKAENWDFIIGRQAVSLGQGALLSTGYDASGVTEMFDGLVASTKAGKFNLSFVGGKGTYTNITTDIPYQQSEVYGIDFRTKVADNVTLGGAYANFHATNGNYHNHFDPQTTRRDWAINFVYDPSSSLTFNGEYAKSNAQTMNRAYFLAGTYKWDRDSFTIQYNNVQDQSVDYGLSGISVVNYPFKNVDGSLWGEWYKGFTYSYDHQFSKTTSFNLTYMDLKTDYRPGSDKELAAGVTWKF